RPSPHRRDAATRRPVRPQLRLASTGVHENVLESGLGRAPCCDILTRSDLVVKALLAEPLEKRAEKVASGIELVVVLDDELTDLRDAAGIHQLRDHIVLG